LERALLFSLLAYRSELNLYIGEYCFGGPVVFENFDLKDTTSFPEEESTFLITVFYDDESKLEFSYPIY